MKTDSLFYLLFQTAPIIFFDLIGQPAAVGVGYRFSSVELKQTAFRIDGVFLPPAGQPEQPVYFVEVQFQKDERLYRRLFAEIFLFLHQHPDVNHWQAVVIYPRANLEPEDLTAYGGLLASGQCQRVYLDHLVGAEPSTLGVGLVRLIVEPDQTAAVLARTLMEQAKVAPLPVLDTIAIIELIETIVVYKFPRLNREEIAEMLSISDLRQTKVFQEFYEDGLQQGQQQGLQQGQQQGLQQGLQQEGVILVKRQLTRRLGQLPADWQDAIATLSVPQLEDLGEALLDFAQLTDLEAWLSHWKQSQQNLWQTLRAKFNQEMDEWEASLIAQIEGLTPSQAAALAAALEELPNRTTLEHWLQAQKQVDDSSI